MEHGACDVLFACAGALRALYAEQWFSYDVAEGVFDALDFVFHLDDDDDD